MSQDIVVVGSRFFRSTPKKRLMISENGPASASIEQIGYESRGTQKRLSISSQIRDKFTKASQPIMSYMYDGWYRRYAVRAGVLARVAFKDLSSKNTT